MSSLLVACMIVALASGCAGGATAPDDTGPAPTPIAEAEAELGVEAEVASTVGPAAGPSDARSTSIPVDQLPREIPYRPLSGLDVGEVSRVDVWASCGIAIEVGDERFLPDREIAPYPGRDWMVSDFPSNWNVVVFNEAPQDGPSWVILDAFVERLDQTTLAVHDNEQALIAYFELDATPEHERITCP